MGVRMDDDDDDDNDDDDDEDDDADADDGMLLRLYIRTPTSTANNHMISPWQFCTINSYYHMISPW